MTNIWKLILELSISKDKLSKLYKKVSNQNLWNKTEISAKDVEAIKKELWAKTPSKETKSKKAVVKSKEFGSSKWGFFSWLGFEAPKAEKEPKDSEEKQDELLVHAAANRWKKPVETPPTFSGENATVIRKAAPTTNTRPGHQRISVRPWVRTSPPRVREKPTVWVRPSYQRTWVRPSYQRGGQRPNNNVWNRVIFSRGRAQTRTLAPTPAAKNKKIATTSDTLIKKEALMMWNSITVKEFSEKMWVSLQELLKVMLQNKVMWWINTALDFDTAALIGEEFNVEVKAEEKWMNIDKILTWDLQAILDLDKDSEKTLERPPVVTVMWHVDHWKTSLLDYLRKSNITGGEAGGITQSIGASSMQHNWKKITFIDTPWHQLFTALRARGAKLTNIAIIIIAADDGIKPQTIESINHAKDSGVPIIVAVTKIDKPNNNFEKIKTDIGNFWLIPEEWGGDVPVVGVSSVTWAWMNDLLDLILLQAEMLELKYNPDRKAVWVVLDAHKDPRQWISTSLIVLSWTLKVWDILVVHNKSGKVKRMQDFRWKPLKKAVWWDPVMILWLSDIPEPGRVVEAVKNEKEAKERIEIIQNKVDQEDTSSTMQHFLQQMKNEDKAELKLILKADWPSSLEALNHAIDWIPMPESVTIKKIHSDVWDPTDSDVTLAQAADAVVVGFNTKTHTTIKKKAEMLKVSVKNFSIIYELVDTIEQLVNGLIEIEMHEVVIWKLKVLATFFKKEKMMVIWGKVIEGKIKNWADFRAYREDEGEVNLEGERQEFTKWKITSLQKDQESVNEISEWHECGMKITSSKRLAEGDILEFYVMEEKT